MKVPLFHPDCSLNEDNYSLRCPKHKVKKERLVSVILLRTFLVSVKSRLPFQRTQVAQQVNSLSFPVYPEHPASQVSLPGAVRERLRGTERTRRHKSLGAVSSHSMFPPMIKSFMQIFPRPKRCFILFLMTLGFSIFGNFLSHNSLFKANHTK